MPWNGIAPAQTFGRTDGTRTGATTWQQADAASVDIISPDHDTHDQDIADGLNSCIKKDGGNTATANLPMGGFRHTNVGAAAARTDYAQFKDVQDGKGRYVPTVGGTANAITLTTGYSVDAYAAGQTFYFIAASTNSGATTVAVDGLAAKSVKVATTDLSAGQIIASTMIEITYDGTQFQLKNANAAPAALSVGIIAGWPTSTVPTGWLECDGSAVSRSTYSALFAAISTNYGVGDGSTTFNLPNYKDYFLRGYDAAGTDAASRTDRGDGTTGANVGTKQAGGVESHTHTASVTDPGHSHTAASDKPDIWAQLAGGGGTSGSGTLKPLTQAITVNSNTTGITVTNANTGGTETRPKNITVKWCILALPTAALAIGTGFTRSPRLIHTGALPARVSTDGSEATAVNTETYIAEIYVPGPGSVTVTGIALMNGSSVAGNAKLGLADSSGNIVASTASTAVSGTDAYQRIALSATYDAVGPATYYVVAQFSNNANTFNTHTFGNFGASKKTGQTYGTLTTITPPTTFTTALGPIASLY